jgi:hypothetical protein
LLLLASSALIAFAGIAGATSGPRVVVEITARAEQQVDSRLTRRLIELELGDLELPPRASEPHPRSYSSVFFRVLVPRTDALRVELWDRGEFHGARSVSGHGSRQLRARRVALGAAELVRRLREKRLAEARQLAEQQERAAREQAEREAWEQKPTLALASRASGALIGPGDLWLAGPGLSGQLRLGHGARLDLGARWLWGGSPELDQTRVTWLELELAPSYALRITPSFDLDLGLQAAAASVHLSRVAAVDGIAGADDTWSARAGVVALAEPRLSDGARLSLGPELGVVLRRIPVRDDAGRERQLGGVWIGASLALLLDPTNRL